ncbi:MAG: MMPL family transporter [Candidatus Thiodiazotropha endolucinida]
MKNLPNGASGLSTSHPVNDAESILERLIFGNRLPVLIMLFFITAIFAYAASQLRPNASFEKMIPTFHPYIANYIDNKGDLRGLGNVIRIAVETTDEDIFTREYMETLKQINDEVFYIPGVDRGVMKSLWTPNVRWNEVTEEGFAGGPIFTDVYDGSDDSMELVRGNILKSGQVGTLVANNFKSTIILVPLLSVNPETGEPLDYKEFSDNLETHIRDKYQNVNIRIHIIGFAKVIGDLIDGAKQIALFFAIAIFITMVLLYMYSRCIRSTLIPVICSIIAVIWQLGILRLLGLGIDPYSILIPFLVFAIGVSHGVQVINGMAIEALHGRSPYQQASLTFRSLYLAGLTALASDGVGFFTLMAIDIDVIQELAIAASVGVAVIILTNLVLLPVLMSYVGVSKSCVRYLESKRNTKHPIWDILSKTTHTKTAWIVTILAVVALTFGLLRGQEVKIGDLDPGAPELRADSRYNIDNAFLTENYSTSTDVFVIMAKTKEEKCSAYDNLALIDRLEWKLQNLPGVQSTKSLVSVSKLGLSALNEGNPKWYALNRNRLVANASLVRAPRDFFNTDCSMAPILVYLEDHKAETLSRVVEAVEVFSAEHVNEEIELLLAAGNAGIEAATNIVIETAQYTILAWVYGVVGLLVLLTFRSVKAVICIIAPLAFTSVLAHALMSYLGIGVKVATLPVITLGVGIGVDYGIYIYTKLKTYLDRGESLFISYYHTLRSTGKAVIFTGITLAIGVATWALSPIKFQADMGILLTFMFIWNMLGAVILLPALVRLIINPDADTRPEKSVRVESGRSV